MAQAEIDALVAHVAGPRAPAAAVADLRRRAYEHLLDAALRAQSGFGHGWAQGRGDAGAAALQTLSFALACDGRRGAARRMDALLDAATRGASPAADAVLRLLAALARSTGAAGFVNCVWAVAR